VSDRKFQWVRWFIVVNRNDLGYATKAAPTLWHVSVDGIETICGKQVNFDTQYELPDCQPVFDKPYPILDFTAQPPQDRHIRACRKCARISESCAIAEMARSKTHD
jgi:hypothetical protein